VVSDRRTGRFLGIPYDWRRPTLERVRREVWNPQERRLLVPKAFGWGYGVNLAEVARRLGLQGNGLDDGPPGGAQ
jgi:hypothetical protein